MHSCLMYSLLRAEGFREEYSWSLALYIELDISNREVIVCRHPSYTVIEDLNEIARDIHGIMLQGDEAEVISGVFRILNSVLPDWRKGFEIVVRRGFDAVSVYL